LKDYDYRITGESAFRFLTLKQKLGENVVDYYAQTAMAIEDSTRGLGDEGTEAEKTTQKKTIKHFHR